MNSKNSKTSHSHRLLLYLSDKIDLKRTDKYVAVSNLNICYTWKNIKKSYKNNNLTYQLQNGMINLNYLTDCILYQIFEIKRNTEKRLIILQ